jgi:hypothetical protein
MSRRHASTAANPGTNGICSHLEIRRTLEGGLDGDFWPIPVRSPETIGVLEASAHPGPPQLVQHAHIVVIDRQITLEVER